MQTHLIVSERGQVTLPASLRKRLGIKGGDVLIVDDREGSLVLRPAAVVEVELYSDAQVAEWDAEDRLDEAERGAIRKRLRESRR